MRTLLVPFFCLVFGLCVDGQRRGAKGSKSQGKTAAPPVLQPQEEVLPVTPHGPPNHDIFFPLPPGFQVEPDLDETKPAVTQGGKIKKLRQGPYKVPVGGQVDSTQQWNPMPGMPCTDCYITAIQGGLEFEDGTPAHINEGVMLQHLIILSEKIDHVCTRWNLPQPNRIYTSGNERETIRLNAGGTKYGFYVAPEDLYFVRFNVVNVGKKPLAVYLTQSYEYVEASKAEGYRNVTTAYIDMNGCGGTSFTPTSGKYDLKSFEWKSDLEGPILFAHGHVHEGGHNTTLFINSEPVCTSAQLYGRKGNSIDPFGKKHISDNSVCTNIGSLKNGDWVYITTSYDSSQHPYDKSMPLNGFESIMAINNIYIGLPN